ncbi:MAG: hypothetical protein DMD86_09620 [Candidatus Rokuibacteriota bacterium]|nr:MAG: hypothetical protein DMD86_09620 [Candidatus Rokubacteria bacterium]
MGGVSAPSAHPALAAAVEAARAAGEIAMRYYRGGVEVTIKPDRTPVTQADREAEQIALEERGEITTGVALNPVTDELFTARRGEGAYKNGERLRVSECEAMKDSTVLHSGLRLVRETGHWDGFVRLFDAGSRTRGFGDYYGYGLVAEGKAEIYVEVDLKPWDVAPVKILVEEAGGRLTDFAGRPTIYGSTVLATNGRLHAEALRLLAGR